MKGAVRQRSILHVDLDPFFVSVERALDPTLRGRPVIVGPEHFGSVAAASSEARARGVRPGQRLAKARRLCPEAVWRPGDLEAYAVFSEDVTALLLTQTRRVERPSVDEAYLDLTPETHGAPSPIVVAETVRAELEGRLRLEASLGLAASRLAARRASSWARPRGLLVVFPGYESALLGEESLSELPELPPNVALSLARIGIHTLGDVIRAEDAALVEVLGPEGASHLKDRARGLRETPIAVVAQPSVVPLSRDPAQGFLFPVAAR
jgi:DNA polymerase-4